MNSLCTNFVIGLKTQVIRAAGNVQKDLNISSYEQLIKLNNRNTEILSNIAIFDSFDEKLKQVGLCEHRAENIRGDFADLVNYNQNKQKIPISITDLKSYIKEQCVKIQAAFNPLKEAVALLKETPKIESVLRDVPINEKLQSKEITRSEREIKTQIKRYKPKKYIFENSKKTSSISKEFKKSIKKYIAFGKR